MASPYTTRILELVSVLPAFSWEDTGKGIEIVRGVLSPFGAHPVEDVATAIQARRKMGLDINGALLLPTAVFSKNPLSEAVNLVVPRGYTFEMHLPNNRRHPQFFAVDPIINRDLYPNQPHLFLGSIILPTGITATGICLYGYHLEVWNPDSDSLLTLMTWLSVWFACHAVWEQGGGWLGKDTPHTQAEIVTRYRKNECFCGSRLQMQVCVPTHPTPARNWRYQES
jgi:hypothetical protein